MQACFNTTSTPIATSRVVTRYPRGQEDRPHYIHIISDLLEHSLSFIYVHKTESVVTIMAEAILILGLAANIVQFLDVGSKFVSSVCSIYWSGRNEVDENLDLTKTTSDLKTILDGFQTPDGNNKEVIEGEHGLRQLAGECQTVAIQLLNSLNKISQPDKIRKRDALRVAFRTTWKEDEIRHMQVRLEGFRHQLTFHLLALLRSVPSPNRPFISRSSMLTMFEAIKAESRCTNRTRCSSSLRPFTIAQNGSKEWLTKSRQAQKGSVPLSWIF